LSRVAHRNPTSSPCCGQLRRRLARRSKARRRRPSNGPQPHLTAENKPRPAWRVIFRTGAFRQ
jgi:hypothetical protein